MLKTKLLIGLALLTLLTLAACAAETATPQPTTIPATETALPPTATPIPEIFAILQADLAQVLPADQQLSFEPQSDGRYSVVSDDGKQKAALMTVAPASQADGGVDRFFITVGTDEVAGAYSAEQGAQTLRFTAEINGMIYVWGGQGWAEQIVEMPAELKDRLQAEGKLFAAWVNDKEGQAYFEDGQWFNWNGNLGEAEAVELVDVVFTDDADLIPAMMLNLSPEELKAVNDPAAKQKLINPKDVPLTEHEEKLSNMGIFTREGVMDGIGMPIELVQLQLKNGKRLLVTGMAIIGFDGIALVEFGEVGKDGKVKLAWGENALLQKNYGQQDNQGEKISIANNKALDIANLFKGRAIRIKFILPNDIYQWYLDRIKSGEIPYIKKAAPAIADAQKRLVEQFEYGGFIAEDLPIVIK